MRGQFHFRLEKVLNIRSWSEEAARLELGKAMSVVNGLERRLAENKRAREAVVAADFDADLIYGMQALSNYQMRLDNERQRLAEELEQAEKLAEVAAEAWREAAAQKKVLETLKDRRYAEFSRAARQAEDKELDEIAQTRTRGYEYSF